MKPVCLLTGSGGRLGTALCRTLSAEYNVVAVYRQRIPCVSSQLVSQVDNDASWAAARESLSVFCVQADLTRREDLRRLVEVALAKFDVIDAIVNAAADVNFHGKLLELWHDDEYAPLQMQTNCIAPIELVSAVHQQCWKDQSNQNLTRNRCVINMSCLSGIRTYGTTGQGFSACSAAALNMLTFHLSLELAPYSVRANSVCMPKLRDQSSIKQAVEAVTKLLSGKDSGTIVSLMP